MNANPLNSAEKKLAKSLTFKTASQQDPSDVDVKQFKAFHDFLQEAFPLIHKNLNKELINKLSLLFTWKGSDSNLKPAIFLAHQDVAPIAPGTEGDWDHPQFEGVIDDNFI